MNEIRQIEEIERAITRYMADHGVDRNETIRQVLRKWFEDNEYLATPTEQRLGLVDRVQHVVRACASTC